MLVLPISIASSIGLRSILDRSHIPGDDSLPFAPIIFHEQRAVAIDAHRLADQHVSPHLHPYRLSFEPEAGLPAGRDGVETGLLENSIAPVEVVNQSPQKVLAADPGAGDFHQGSGSLPYGVGHQRGGKIEVDANAEDHELNPFGVTRGFRQDSRQLLALEKNIVGPFDRRRLSNE